MARRGSPARGRGGRKRRRRAGPLWLVVPLAALVLLPVAADFVRSAWMALVAGIALVAALAAVAVLAARRLGAAYRREALARAGLDRLDPRRFEELTAELLRRDGFRGVRVVGGRGDGGVDVVGVAPGGRPYAIQCKYYTRPVGPGEVRDLVGALRARPYRDHQGVLVTTHRLSAQAARTAREHGLIVVDRDRLADWLLEACRLGPDRPPVSWVARLRRGRALRRTDLIFPGLGLRRG
ncbi:restriction endonuclease [Thermoactinospora rubra]|uniref:restriction endonuclease n=1 Tax=Thermoactinospora rubra TaxID=1088767 RepID=UPI000A1008A8|nr:restriction endonuclease [Thermoactinospora rubra]